MTNKEYILSSITDQELAKILTHNSVIRSPLPRVNNAYMRWASKKRGYRGNYMDDNQTENVNTWYTLGYYLDHRNGENKVVEIRSPQVCYQVWLSLQYNEEDWSE